MGRLLQGPLALPQLAVHVLPLGQHAHAVAGAQDAADQVPLLLNQPGRQEKQGRVPPGVQDIQNAGQPIRAAAPEGQIYRRVPPVRLLDGVLAGLRTALPVI